MISKEVYVEIKVMRRQGKSLRQIAEAVGCAVNTVRSHILSADIPRYERKVKRPGKLAGFESYLRERLAAAHPNWIPASVLYREIVEQGYSGGTSLLRAFMHTLKPPVPAEPVIRFETQAGVQMQVDWVEFRKGQRPLYAFCATLGYSRASYVEFVSDMKVTTLISCHEHAFSAFGGVPKDVLYDNMKTVIVERDAYGEGEHRFHAGFLDYARHCGFVIKLCRPYRAKTKGKVERFNGYLRRSFYIPLVAKLKQAGLALDVSTANAQVQSWLADIANQRIHGTTGRIPAQSLIEERSALQALAPAWRGDVAAARPQAKAEPQAKTQATHSPFDLQPDTTPRPVVVQAHIEAEQPVQHPLEIYEQLLNGFRQLVEVTP